MNHTDELVSDVSAACLNYLSDAKTGWESNPVHFGPQIHVHSMSSGTFQKHS